MNFPNNKQITAAAAAAAATTTTTTRAQQKFKRMSCAVKMLAFCQVCSHMDIAVLPVSNDPMFAVDQIDFSNEVAGLTKHNRSTSCGY